MALEDPEKTWSRFEKLAGETWTTTSTGFHGGENGVDAFKRNQELQMQRVSRLNIQDLKEQTEGQAHVFDKSDIHRVQIFHHGVFDDALIQNFRLNRMLQIKPPSDEEVERLVGKKNSVKRIASLTNAFKNGDIKYPEQSIPAGLSSIHNLLESDSFNPLNAFLTFAKEEYENALEVAGDRLDSFDDDSPASNANSDIESLIGSDDESTESSTSTTDSGNVDLEALLGSESSDEQSLDSDLQNAIDANGENVDLNSFEIEPVSEDHISDVLKEAEELWVSLDDEEDQFSMPLPSELQEELTEINEISGLPTDIAKTEAISTIKGISEAVSYNTSEPIIDAEEDDEETLLAAIMKLDSNE